MIQVLLAVWIGLILPGIGIGEAVAQTFPARPMRIIVNAPPGGPTDQLGRVVAIRVTESIGQPVVVDNRPGGGAQIAAAQLMQAPADGHTVLLGDIGAFAINSTLYAKLSFDPLRDFQPITTLVSAPVVLVVAAASPVNSLDELLASAQVRQGRLTFASPGIGSGSHLAGEMWKARTGTNLVHIPYSGVAPATQALVAGGVDFMFQVIGSALPLARVGKIKMLAVAAQERSSRAPEVPTMAELGHPDVHMSPWFGMVARAGTPEGVVRRLNAELIAALAHPDTTKRLTELGFDPLPSSPEHFRSFMRDEIARWGSVVRRSGARAE